MSEGTELDPVPSYQTPPPGPPSGGPMAMSVASLIIGFFSCPSGLALPICGCPVSIVGIASGIAALLWARKTVPQNNVIKIMAIIGLILSCLGMLITVANAAWGVYMATHPATGPASAPAP